MHLNDLTITGGAEAHSVVLQTDVLANCVKPASNQMKNLGVSVIKELPQRLPDQPSA